MRQEEIDAIKEGRDPDTPDAGVPEEVRLELALIDDCDAEDHREAIDRIRRAFAQQQQEATTLRARLREAEERDNFIRDVLAPAWDSYIASFTDGRTVEERRQARWGVATRAGNLVDLFLRRTATPSSGEGEGSDEPAAPSPSPLPDELRARLLSAAIYLDEIKVNAEDAQRAIDSLLGGKEGERDG